MESFSFETRYANQEVLERERSIPSSLEVYTKGKVVKVGYSPFPKMTSEIIKKGISDHLVFWTNDDEDSIYKIGYPDGTVFDCNLTDQDRTDKDGNSLYYSYACFNHSKMVYFTHLMKTPMDFFDFTVNPPPYTSSPYLYEHKIVVVGREMNSFNMCLSSRLVKRLEESILEWTTRKGVRFISTNATQLITVPLENTPESDVKIQMCVHPHYLYWVVETLIRNYERLVSHGMGRFKFLYLVGEFKLYRITEVYPDVEIGKSIDTYGDYRREVLNPPNIVFYLKNNADIKSIVDTLCELFPENDEVTFGVPRFNMRLNRNVYISFEGHNEKKYDLKQLFTPKEYERILETKNPAYNELSHMFSGHTLMLPDGSKNNIQSYKKLIRRGSFEELYASHGLMDYYQEVFGAFNQAFEEKSRSRFKSSAKSVSRSRSRSRSLSRSIPKSKANALKSKSRFKSWAKSFSKLKSVKSVKNASFNKKSNATNVKARRARLKKDPILGYAV